MRGNIIIFLLCLILPILSFAQTNTVISLDTDEDLSAAISDSLALSVLKTAVDDSILSWLGKEFPAPIPDFPDTTASGLDSTTVKPLFNIDGGQGRTKMLYVYGNASSAQDSTIWAATFNPSFLKCDSLYFYLSMADSAVANCSFFAEIWTPTGTALWKSGRITAGTSSTRKSFPFTGFSTLDEYVIVYRFRLKDTGDAMTIGQTYFKRN